MIGIGSTPPKQGAEIGETAMKMIMRRSFGCMLLLIGWGFCWTQDVPKPVQVTLCDLYQYPEQYAGRMVKVRAGAISDLSLDNILHDSPTRPCPTYMRIIVEFPDQVTPAPGFQLVRDEPYKKLLEALHNRRATHIDATYEGRFDAAFAWRDHKRIKIGQDKEKGFGIKHEYDGRIVLYQVSDVWAQPVPQR